MQTTANILTGTSFTGEKFIVTKAVLISHKDEDTIIVWRQDGTIDIAGYGSGYKCLADEAFEDVVRTQDLRSVTYINRDGQIVELQRIDGTTYIKKITKYVKDKVTSQYDKPRNKARIQGFGQNVAPFIDAGFGVNSLINKDDFDPTTLQTHHINGRESDDRPENLVTLPYFVHYKLHKRNVNRDTELLYDEEAYIGRCLAQVNKERRDEILLNLNEFETFCEGLGIEFKYRSKLYKARHVMITAFDTSTDNKLDIVYEEGFAREVLRLQHLYYLGKRRLKVIVEIELEEQGLVVTQ